MLTVAALLVAAWLSCTVYWKFAEPAAAGVNVMEPSGFTVAVPLVGGATMLTDAGFKVSPLSGSVSFANTGMVIGVVALAVTESPLATGGWFRNATFNETSATFESIPFASVLM